MTITPFDTTRRRRLGAASGAIVLGAPAIVRAQSGPKMCIGFWPVAAGLPFFAAIIATKKLSLETSLRCGAETGAGR